MSWKIFLVVTMLLLSPLAFAQYGYGYPDDDDDDTADEPRLELELVSTCDGNVITVTSKGDPVNNADVTVFIKNGPPLASGDTNSDGEFTFEGCGYEVELYASKSGYKPTGKVLGTLVSCSQCEEPECTKDTDCPDKEQCVDEECVPVECECGVVQNHQCNEYDCCSDSDCPAGQVCEDHSCKEKETETEGCKDDSGCEPHEYCNKVPGAATGNCEPVTGDCGYAENHVWVGYECGPEAGCPQCPEGYVCVDRLCEEEEQDLQGPGEGVVDGEAEFKATRGGEPCDFCDIRYIDPRGDEGTGQTDENGNFMLPLKLEGAYKVALMQNGEVVKELTLQSMPKSPAEDEGKPTAAGGEDITPIILLLLAILLIVVGVLLLRRRSSGKTPRR